MTRYRLVPGVLSLTLAAFIIGGTSPDSWGKRGDRDDDDGGDDGGLPLGAATIIIETTDNDIELQAFIDGSLAWRNFEISSPWGSKIFNMKTKSQLRRQGMSELFFASSPDHFAEDAPSDAAQDTVDEFLKKFPAGAYEFEAKMIDGNELEGDAMLTHVIPALPEITAPVSDTDRTTRPSCSAPASVTVPPGAVNRNALSSRFARAWSMRSRSILACGMCDSTSTNSSIPASSACPSKSSRASSRIGRACSAAGRTTNAPASMRAISSSASISRPMRPADRAMICACSRRSSSSNGRSTSRSAAAATTPRGLRRS